MDYRSVLVAGMLLAPPVAAQVAAPPKGPVAPLAFMLGQWEGPAWMDMGPRGRREVRQHEWVRTTAGGSVIAVQGQGTATLPDGSEQLVFDAFAVMYRDHEGKLAMRAYRGDGVCRSRDRADGERPHLELHRSTGRKGAIHHDAYPGRRVERDRRAIARRDHLDQVLRDDIAAGEAMSKRKGRPVHGRPFRSRAMTHLPESRCHEGCTQCPSCRWNTSVARPDWRVTIPSYSNSTTYRLYTTATSPKSWISV